VTAANFMERLHRLERLHVENPVYIGKRAFLITSSAPVNLTPKSGFMWLKIVFEPVW
jgi:hypothetical protein